MAMSRFEEILQAIVNGEDCDLTPQSRAEVLLLALLDTIQSGSGGGGGSGTGTGTVNLSNYYKKPQVDALLAAKADSTDLDDYYLKTQTYSQSEVDTALADKVDKVAGKVLSQENYTTEEKTKLAGLNNYDDTALAGRVTVIEGDYANKTYVNEQIVNLDNLNKQIVDTLPSDSEASNNTIYMMKTTGSSGDEYEMYTKIDGTLVLIGNTSVDLTGYAKTVDIDKKLDNKADKTEIPTFTNKTVLDGITNEKIKEWDAKSDFDGDYNSLINKPDTSNSEETKTHILTDIYGEEGVHGFRYYNNTLQVQNAEGDWFDVISGGGTGTIMPKPVSNATIKNKNAQCIITWQDPDDFVLDGVVLADWKGTKLVMSETSFPTNEQDGTLVVDNTEKGKYATDGYTVNNLVNGTTYYFTLFTYSSDGAYNYKQAVHLTGQPSLVKLDPCTNITAVASPEKVTVTWTDPDETKTVDGNTATWAKTVLVYKEGLDAPTSIDDGTVAVEEQTRNQYQTTGYDISGLEDGKDYSFSVFAISTENAISDKISTTTKLYAILVVKTSESKLYGKQVKAVSGSKTVTDTFNTSGQATLNIPWIGETTVTATDGTDTATEKVAISNYGQIYSLDLSFSKIVTFANGTDEEIKAMIDAHYANKINIKDYWAVGDKRTVHLSAMSATRVGKSHREQDVQMAIADFDHDDLTTAINGHTKAAVTLTQVDCLMDEANANSPTSGSSNTENGYMNSTNTNSGGWTSSARRTWCNDVYYNALPDSFKSMVKPVKKLTSAGAQSTTINTKVDKVFLLSEVEIYGTTTYSVAGEGSQYTYYETASNKYKNPKWSSSSNSCAYWQRSPYSSSPSFFCHVGVSGSGGCGYASSAYGLAPCLCI